MSNFHRFRKFRQFSELFRKFDWNIDKWHHFLEFVAKFGKKKSTKISEKKRKNRRKKYRKIGKNEFSFFIRAKILTIFGWNFEVWAVQRYVDLVDLVKTFPTNIYLQRSASIQPRMSLSKFWGDFFIFINYSFASIGPPQRLAAPVARFRSRHRRSFAGAAVDRRHLSLF